MANNSDEVMALNALLGLTGQLLDHRASMKSLKTQADLKREEMKIKIMEQQKANELELKKHAINIAIDDIQELKRKKASANKELEKITGMHYDFSAKDKTKAFDKTVKNMGSSNISRWDQLSVSYDQTRDKLQGEVDTIRRELGRIRPVLNTIEQRVHPGLAGDLSRIGIDDYEAIEKIAYKMEDMEESQTKYMKAAVRNFRPGYDKILQLNNFLAQGENRDTNQSLREAAVLQNASEYADKDVEQMLMIVQSPDVGGNSTMLEGIMNKINDAGKSGEEVYGKTWKDKESGTVAIRELELALQAGSMHSLEYAMKRVPWIASVLQKEMPGLWLDYVRNRKYYQGIAESRPLSNSKKSNNQPKKKKDDNNNTINTFESDIDSLFD